MQSLKMRTIGELRIMTRQMIADRNITKCLKKQKEFEHKMKVQKDIKRILFG